MRVTPNMTADNALFNIQKDRTRIDRLTEQISANMNILKPSDDPITTRQLLDLQNIVKAGEQYISNIDKASIWLNVTDTALTAMGDMATTIQGIVANVSGGTDNSAEGQRMRNDAISQLKEMRRQLIDLGNTQIGDQYVFAGFSNNTRAFDTNPNTLVPVTDPLYNEPLGTFLGTGDDIDVNIGKNSTLTMNITGDAVLKGSVNGVSPGPFGGLDILGTLDNLIGAINTNNTGQIQSFAAQFYDSTNQINNARGEVASRLLRLESSKNMITRDQNTALGIISDRQNVDFAKAATELNQEKIAFEAALSATAKISQISLLNYL